MSHLLTFSDALESHARLSPDKTGARDSQRSLTYAQWHVRASQLADALLATGLIAGDRVAVLATNRIEWMEIYVALTRAGLVAVPLNFRLQASEIQYILHDAGASAIIAEDRFCATIDSIANTLDIPPPRYISLPGEPQKDWQPYEALIEHGNANTVFPAINASAMCALMYTSGTTGRPKGAIRSHEGSALIALATALEMGFTRDDTALLVMPLCHANSLYFGATFLHLGATIIVDDSASFDAEQFLALMTRQQVTFTSLVPTHCIMLLALPESVKKRYELQRVNKLMISSAPARREIKLGVMDLFPNCSLYELYGSTEAGWVTLLRPHEQLDKIGSVGREWSGSGAIRLLDDNRHEVPDGEVGELFSRSPYVFDGYWHNDEKTNKAFEGQWCSVGDMARRDEDGFIWLVDRKNNMIISGGENIYPSEIEATLGAHPDVQDVAAIGVADDKWGEVVHAVVVRKPGTRVSDKDLRVWCRERLAKFKCPAAFSFMTEDQIPRTATGKILHRVLKDGLAAHDKAI